LRLSYVVYFETISAMTLDIYADLFDDDLEAVATALHDARARESVGKMWARGGQNVGTGLRGD
jgi:hypothetical protein